MLPVGIGRVCVNLDCCAHLPSNQQLSYPSLLSSPILSFFDNLQLHHLYSLSRISQYLRYKSLTSSLPSFVVAKRSGKSGRGGRKKTQNKYKRASRQPREYKASTISSRRGFLHFQDTTCPGLPALSLFIIHRPTS